MSKTIVLQPFCPSVIADMVNSLEHDDTDRAAERAALVALIAREVEATRDLIGRSHLDPRVIAALSRVPRHAFVPPAARHLAYHNRPLEIGLGQTISQPYMVAVMTDLLELEPASRVLEIGTGCGYQAAVLAELSRQVTSVERLPALAESAARKLPELGYSNVTVEVGDGAKGWPANAPYDAIMVTAAALRRVPQPLLDQLAPGGRLVAPVERSRAGFRFLGFGSDQELLLVKKNLQGQLEERALLPVAFVPLIEARD